MAKPIKDYKRKAWDTFSIWIRKRDKKCYTCGKTFWDEQLGEFTINGLVAGHFKHGVLDFDPMNIHAQCDSCNRHWSGKLDVYAENLIRDYGLKAFKELCLRSKEALRGDKKTDEEYALIIDKYRSK